MWSRLVLLLLTLTSIFGEEIDQELVSANNLFTANVYKEVLKNGENNFLVSPFSAQTILALTQSGAGGKTQEELRTGLNLPNDQNKIETAFKSLVPKLKSENLYTFRTANKLYLGENFTIKDGFKKVATEVFDAGLENIKFSPDNVKAAETMNKWVEEQTESKIKNLISPDKLDAATEAILINALYFKGNWSIPFSTYATSKQNFYQIDKSASEVDTMFNFATNIVYNYAESEELDAKLLELPFQGGDVSMVIVLPNEKDGIGKLEKQIDKVFVEPDFGREYVKISLPKFKTESKIDFKKILRNLGVSKPFAPGADFSGISDQNLLISDVLQKTYIDVNEGGVEAAAATYVAASSYSAHFIIDKPKEFYADHPFIYYIKIKNLVVFAGRVGLPSYY